MREILAWNMRTCYNFNILKNLSVLMHFIKQRAFHTKTKPTKATKTTKETKTTKVTKTTKMTKTTPPRRFLPSTFSLLRLKDSA